MNKREAEMEKKPFKKLLLSLFCRLRNIDEVVKIFNSSNQSIIFDAIANFLPHYHPKMKKRLKNAYA